MDPQTAAAVDAAVASGELHRIAAILDAAELEAPHPLPAAWPTALHVLAHALNGDLPDARHAHRRLSPDTASAGAGPLADQAAALRVLRRLWPGDGGPVTAAAVLEGGGGNDDGDDTALAALEGHAWPAGATAAVAAALARAVRARAAADVARSYSRLPLNAAAKMLGFRGRGEEEGRRAAAEAMRAAGWRVVEGPGGAAVVEPRAAPGGHAEPQLDAGALRRLTEYVAHLEGDGFAGLLAAGRGAGGAAGGSSGVEAAAAAAAAVAGG